MEEGDCYAVQIMPSILYTSHYHVKFTFVKETNVFSLNDPEVTMSRRNQMCYRNMHDGPSGSKKEYRVKSVFIFFVYCMKNSSYVRMVQPTSKYGYKNGRIKQQEGVLIYDVSFLLHQSDQILTSRCPILGFNVFCSTCR
jgi:hypothetical protein